MSDETRAVLTKYKEKGEKSKNELLQQAIEEKNVDSANILLFQRAILGKGLKKKKKKWEYSHSSEGPPAL